MTSRRLSQPDTVQLACLFLFTGLFWGCVAFDPEGSLTLPVTALSLTTMVVSVVCMVQGMRAEARGDAEGHFRLEGRDRKAYLLLGLALGALTLLAIVTNVRVGAYDLDQWLITVFVCLPDLGTRNAARGGGPALPPAR